MLHVIIKGLSFSPAFLRAMMLPSHPITGDPKSETSACESHDVTHRCSEVTMLSDSERARPFFAQVYSKHSLLL